MQSFLDVVLELDEGQVFAKGEQVDEPAGSGSRRTPAARGPHEEQVEASGEVDVWEELSVCSDPGDEKEVEQDAVQGCAWAVPSKRGKRAADLSPEELGALRMERELADKAGLTWQERGPPGPNQGGPDVWRGQKWRKESGRFANRGGKYRELYAQLARSGALTAKGKGKGKNDKQKSKGGMESKGMGKSKGSSSASSSSWRP